MGSEFRMWARRKKLMERPHTVLLIVALVLVLVSLLVLQMLGSQGVGLAIAMWGVALGLVIVGLWRRHSANTRKP